MRFRTESTAESAVVAAADWDIPAAERPLVHPVERAKPDREGRSAVEVTPAAVAVRVSPWAVTTSSSTVLPATIAGSEY